MNNYWSKDIFFFSQLLLLENQRGEATAFRHGDVLHLKEEEFILMKTNSDAIPESVTVKI